MNEYVVTIGGEDVFRGTAGQASRVFSRRSRFGMPIMLTDDATGKVILAQNGHTVSPDSASILARFFEEAEREVRP